MQQFWKIELYLKDGKRSRYCVETRGGLDTAHMVARMAHSQKFPGAVFFGCSGQVAENRDEAMEWMRVK